MKKIIAMVLSLVMLLSGIGVNGEALDFLKNPMTNYTQEGTFSFKVTNVDEIIKIFTGMNGEEAFPENEIFDFGLLFQTLLAFDGNINAKYNVSEDYKNIKMSLDMGCNYNVDLNDKLSMLLKMGAEAWIEVDVSDLQNPTCKLIASTPFSKKYIYLDLFELIESEDDSKKLMLLLVLTHLSDKEFVNDMNSFAVKCAEDYANITEKDGTYTLKFDNDNFLEYIRAVANYMYGDIFSAFSFSNEKSNEQALFSEGSDLKILGEDGITIIYKTKSGSLEESSCIGDISIGLKGIFELFGEEYPLNDDLCIEAELSANYICSEIGTTKVDIPVITEENSISIAELFSKGNEEISPDYFVTEIPPYYVYVEYDDCVSGDELYVPFSRLAEAAFGENIEVLVLDGKVLAESEYFDGFTKLEFASNETTVLVDGVPFDTGKTITADGEIYVSNSFIKDVFGWEIDSFEHDLLNDKSCVWIFTENFEDDDEEENLYVNDYVYAESKYMPQNKNEIYVPLRELLENAYGNGVTLEFENGTITAKSKIFPNFKELKMNIDESVVYVDGKTTAIGEEVVLNEEITYVPISLFTDVFGWSIQSAQHELLYDGYYFEFFTNSAEIEEPYPAENAFSVVFAD